MSHHTSHLSAQVQDPQGPSSAVAEQSIDVRSASHADISRRAYEKFEARGAVHGFDLEDWTSASRELVAETFGHLTLCVRQEISLR
jgi:hypothetical protein